MIIVLVIVAAVIFFAVAGLRFIAAVGNIRDALRNKEKVNPADTSVVSFQLMILIGLLYCIFS